MKPTKRAKKNQARQKLKLESERITKDETQNIETPEELMHSLSDVVHYALTIIFAMILISLLFFVVSKQFDDHFSKQLANRTSMHSETVSKNYVHSFVNSIVGIEPLIEPESKDSGDAIPKKHSGEGIEIDKNKQPSNEDYQKVLVSNIHYLEYMNTVSKAREDLSINANNDDKEITHLLVVPAAGFETKENIFVDIVNYESDKQPSKDEIVENLKKESAFLLASENTEEGKLRNAFSESENELNGNEYEKPSPIVALLKILCLFLLLFLVSFPSTVKSILYKALSKDDLTSPQDMESEKNAQPKFVLKVSDTDDARYSNKL